MASDSIADKVNTWAPKGRKHLLIGVVVMVTFGGVLFAHFATYETGVRSGVILDLRKEGVLFKTIEGNLSMVGIRDMAGEESEAKSEGSIFAFSVQRDPEVLEELEIAVAEGERVHLHYKEKYAAIPWLGKSKYVVVAVERRQPDSEVERPRIDQVP